MTQEEQTALHEAGHHVVATHFGLASFPQMTPNGYTPPGSTEALPYLGVCSHDGTSALRHAAIGWAGVIGEHLAGVQYDWSPPVPLTAKLLRDWFDMFCESGLERLSQGDRAAILGDSRRMWRAFKLAWNILRKNQARTKELARHILEKQRKAVSKPLGRTEALRGFLAGLPADHLDRPKLERILAYLEAGQEPPASLFEPLR